MKTLITKCLALGSFSLLFAAQAVAIELLVLKSDDNADSSKFSEGRETAENYLQQKRQEMRENGYIQIDRRGHAHEASILSKTNDLKPSPAMLAGLKFDPLDVSGGPLTKSVYLGAIDPLEGSSDESHYVTQVVKHPMLGIISIDEYSYATDTRRTRYAISAPPDNVYVAGFPAGYVAMRVSDDLDVGVSQIWFVTDQRHVTLKSYVPVEQNSATFEEFRTIAEFLATQ